jgi:hypothetical protein
LSANASQLRDEQARAQRKLKIPPKAESRSYASNSRRFHESREIRDDTTNTLCLPTKLLRTELPPFIANTRTRRQLRFSAAQKSTTSAKQPVFSPVAKERKRWLHRMNKLSPSLSKCYLCIVYVSEARQGPVLELLQQSMIQQQQAHLPPFPRLIHSFTDDVYNRTSFFLLHSLTHSQTAADSFQPLMDFVRAALPLVDFSKHRGTHPTLGSVDHLLLSPIGRFNNRLSSLLRCFASQCTAQSSTENSSNYWVSRGRALHCTALHTLHPLVRITSRRIALHRAEQSTALHCTALHTLHRIISNCIEQIRAENITT